MTDEPQESWCRRCCLLAVAMGVGLVAISLLFWISLQTQVHALTNRPDVMDVSARTHIEAWVPDGHGRLRMAWSIDRKDGSLRTCLEMLRIGAVAGQAGAVVVRCEPLNGKDWMDD